MEKPIVSLPAGFEGLIALVEILRSEDGCPWDREQTPGQIKAYLLEEAYEVLEAVDSGNYGDVRDELGDLLFHIVFLARIFEEEGNFNMEAVVDRITAKMIRRHPHVFAEAQVSSSALMRAYRIGERAAKLGCDSPDVQSLLKKLDEVLTGLKVSIEEGNSEKASKELGDLLFTVVNLGRSIRVHPETALIATIMKFIKRFEAVERERTAVQEEHRTP
ncbi:MAG: nucleoside triphosphate pyrophosphohydrolase [Deltaproteobacteria bacterium]|nr:nucleoside triphosphate pyrophosphohydrolase [Deltaproteobacteria bacterium]